MIPMYVAWIPVMKIHAKLGGGLLVVSTHLKNMLVKLDHFPNFRGDNKKQLKPPPSIQIGKTCHGRPLPLPPQFEDFEELKRCLSRCCVKAKQKTKKTRHFLKLDVLGFQTSSSLHSLSQENPVHPPLHPKEKRNNQGSSPSSIPAPVVPAATHTHSIAIHAHVHLGVTRCLERASCCLQCLVHPAISDKPSMILVPMLTV